MVGASAGGVEALKAFAAGLPASAARDGDELHRGHLYVAPPDCHVLVTPGVLRLSGGPRENGVRPAVDPTMRSAAQSYAARAVGMVLSGTRDDGTAGLAAIKASGGRALVQDPAESLHPGMPRSAMAHVSLDAVLPVADLARWLAAAARSRRP